LRESAVETVVYTEQKLREAGTVAVEAVGQHQLRQAEQQMEMGRQLQQGFSQVAGYFGQKVRDVVDVGRDVLERAAATPSLHQQAKIGVQGETRPEREVSTAAERLSTSASSLLPFSDPRHAEHALYADAKQRLEAQGHRFPEDRLNQITAQLHKSDFRPGWEGEITVTADKVRALDHQNLWNGTARISLAEPAPPAQQTMQDVQQHDQDKQQQAMEWQQRQEQARSQSGAMR